MHIKTIASAIALTAALGFSGYSYAQTMIGNQNVSEADMERVKVYCEDLQTAENQAVGTVDANDDAENSAVDDSGSEDPADPVTAEPNPEEEPEADVGSVDLDAITLENCIEAGFIEATP